MPLLDTDLIPQDIYEKLFKEGFRGVFLGGCIERKEGSTIRRKAHAHPYDRKKDWSQPKIVMGDYGKPYDNNACCRYAGYICVKSSKPDRLVKDGKLTNLFKHELAHIIATNRGGSGYGKHFKKCADELGYRKMKYDHKY